MRSVEQIDNEIEAIRNSLPLVNKDNWREHQKAMSDYFNSLTDDEYIMFRKSLAARISNKLK